MKYSLPLLTTALLIALVAAAHCADPPGKPSQDAVADAQAAADRLLSDALARLTAHETISAKVRQQIDIRGQQLIGDGLYLQSGSGTGMLLRLELKIQVADQMCSLLQVRDGRDLWIEEQQSSARRVDRIDVREVAQSLGSTRPKIEAFTGGSLPLGGLPEWLHALATNFDFTLAGETEMAGVPVLMLVGRWSADSLESMLPDQQDRVERGKQFDLSKLPDYLPHEVVLLLGQDDLFPYLIDYRRYRPGKQGAAPDVRSLLKVQIYEVRTGAPIDLRQFVYQPGPVDIGDQTRATAKALGRRAARQPDVAP